MLVLLQFVLSLAVLCVFVVLLFCCSRLSVAVLSLCFVSFLLQSVLSVAVQ